MSTFEHTKIFDNLTEKQKSSSSIFDGVLLHVYRDEVILPDGRGSVRELLRFNGAVGIIPVTEDGNVIIEDQFRYPVDQVMMEIPAGKIDGKEEDPFVAAKRELLEETGIIAKKWIPLGSHYPSPAYTDEKITLYLATDLQFEAQKLDEGEFINIRQIPLKDLVDMVMYGEITDGKSQIAILKAARIYGI